MNFDPDNPNLDGDYKALIEVNQKRRAEREQRESPIVPSRPLKHDGGLEDQPPLDANVPPDLSVIQLRLGLMGCAATDDLESLRTQYDMVKEKGKCLCDLDLRDSGNKATILHIAAENGASIVTQFLIFNTSVEFLMETYDVSVRGTPSRKTVLHILSNKGDLKLIKALLDRISPGKQKEAFVRQTILMEITGQRPRHLSSVHIAAINGHTQVLEYFVGIGIDVNFVNNKHDTPVLWAARWNHTETVRSLIRLGADLEQQNDKGSTPLYWAVRYGLKDMAEVLIKEGKADVNKMRKLGLVYPVVLASALGYTQIVQILLENGADVNVKINGGFAPLHHAAQQGNTDTVVTLLDYGASVDAETDFGDTALLIAAQARQQAVVEVLADHGSDIDDRNKDGKSAWDYAIESPTTEFLISFIKCYQKATGQSTKSLVLPTGKTPLHAAALRNDPQKIRCLLDHGVDVSCKDENGNTFFHLAARECSMSVLQEFLEAVDVNCQNDEGDTPIHLACRHGHFEAVKLLLKNVKLGVKNENGETVLHTACKSPLVTSDIVNGIVDMIVKAHNWDLVGSTDKSGNTALHLAAKFERLSILQSLKTVNPHVQNATGESAQHIAVSTRRTPILIEFLNIFRKDMNVDLQNINGETMFHLAMGLGATDMVEVLIGTGCDLAVRNKQGNTALHLLILQSVVNKENISSYLAVFDIIVANATRWWCMRHDLMIPDEEAELFVKYKRRALYFLTTDILNNDGLSVLTLAAKSGAKSVFEHCLHTQDVYMYPSGDGKWKFDVTKLTSVTMTFQRRRPSSRATVAPSDETPVKFDRLGMKKPQTGEGMNKDDESVVHKRNNRSCLELIVRSADLQTANEMLDVVPIKQIVSDYWAAYQWIYAFLLIIHVTNMALLSTYAVRLLSDTIAGEAPQALPYAFLLVWPGFLIFYEIYYVSSALYRRCKDVDESEPAFDDLRSEQKGVSYVIKVIFALTTYYLSHIVQVLYSTLVICWFAFYLLQRVEMQSYVLAAAFIFGWLFSMAFTAGFESVHAFSIMLKNIVIRDITRFLFLYLFILLAFSFAVQVILSLAPADVTAEYPSIGHIMFTVFNLMIGMTDIFEGSIDGGVDRYGRAGFYLRLVYIFYIILTTIILLNLLIAMMTDSYADVKSREGSSWRVGSVKMAINIERAIPFIPKFFTFLGIRKNLIAFVPETSRWLMTLPETSLSEDRDRRDRTTRFLAQLQHDVQRLHDSYGTLSAKVDEILARFDNKSSETLVVQAEDHSNRLHKRRRHGIVKKSTTADLFRPLSPR